MGTALSRVLSNNPWFEYTLQGRNSGMKQEQIDDLKCCGNCLFNGNSCPEIYETNEWPPTLLYPKHNKYFKCWTPDGLTRKQREE